MVTENSNGLMAHYKADEKVALIDNATQENQNTTQVEGTDWKKRYDDLKKHYDSQLDNWKSEKVQLEHRNKVEYKPPKSLEELEAFKNDNPDIYGIAETLAHLKASEEVKTVQEELADLKQLKVKFARDAALKELKSFHPDFEEIKTDPTFKEWAGRQPQTIQDWLFKETDAKLTAKALDFFKSEHHQVTENKTDTSSAANLVNTRSEVQTESKGPKIWSQAEIAKMSLNEFEAQRDEINKAMREGRIRA